MKVAVFISATIAALFVAFPAHASIACVGDGGLEDVMTKSANVVPTQRQRAEATLPAELDAEAPEAPNLSTENDERSKETQAEEQGARREAAPHLRRDDNRIRRLPDSVLIERPARL